MAGPTTAERGAHKPPNTGDGSARSPLGGAPRGRLRVPGPRSLLIALAVVLSGAATIWVLYGSPWLRAERVRTTGTDELSEREVEAVAAVPLGTPLVSVDTDAIEARLRDKLPRVDSVEATRSWPHGIDLKVTERQPVLLLKKGSNYVEVDAKSVRFATVDPLRAPKRVPVLELAADGSPSLKRFGSDRLVAEAVRVRADVPAAVAADTRVIAVRSYDAISLELSGDRTVVWGSSEDGAAKARSLVALMKAAPKARHFDVSAPTAPSVSDS
ncbi:cell division protein FtsQ/DivIB [Streptomyces sp. NPDC058572]|uniref:cell division protein FtsQ/DivIB n=1 Tax=Streptomyces sp. NPDC058572 TaxID=3346546 RepID=UPI0036635C24